MALPLQKTLDVLATTHNGSAVDVLLHGLSVSDELVRTGCLATIIKRRSNRGILEIVRRLEQMSPMMRNVLERNTAVLASGVRQALLHGDPLLQKHALHLVTWFEDYSQLPTLVNLLEDAPGEQRGEVASVIRALVSRLYEHLQFGKHGDASATDSATPATGYLRDAARVRHQVLACLETSSLRFDSHYCRDVVEGVLILGTMEDTFVKKVFQEASPACEKVIGDVLRTSIHPGVLNLFAETMAKNQPPAAVVHALEERSDAEFFTCYLRNWPRKLTIIQQKNLRERQRMALFEGPLTELALIPAGLHRNLLLLLLATSVSDDCKLAVLEWLVKFGSPEGRLAATEVLANLETLKVKEVVIEGLDSEEPDIQAWATSQLRTRDVPHAFELLIQRLDSPLTEVREAARRELGAFDITRVLEMYDFLDAKIRRAVGGLLLKIDPQTVDKLRTELATSINRKRIHAARASQGLGLQVLVRDSLLQMLQDSDFLVRRTAAEVLGSVPAPEVVDALSALLSDMSPRIRETAARSLKEIQEGTSRDASVASTMAAEAGAVFLGNGADVAKSVMRSPGLVGSIALLASLQNWQESLVQFVGGPERFAFLLYSMLSVLGVGAAYCALQWFTNGTRGLGGGNTARSLFAELCRAHQLSRSEKRLLLRAAAGDEVCLLFVDPSVLQRLAEDSTTDAGAANALRRKLFGE